MNDQDWSGLLDFQEALLLAKLEVIRDLKEAYAAHRQERQDVERCVEPFRAERTDADTPHSGMEGPFGERPSRMGFPWHFGVSPVESYAEGETPVNCGGRGTLRDGRLEEPEK